MSTEEEEAYRQVTNLLENAKNLAPKVSSIPSLVSLRDVVKEPPVEDELPSSLLKPNHGHHALFRALEDLEKLESELILEQAVLHKITSTVTNEPLESSDYPHSTTTGTNQTLVSTDDAKFTATATKEPLKSKHDALATLQAIGRSIPRRVCQHPFKKNDIVWVCRTCQADESKSQRT